MEGPPIEEIEEPEQSTPSRREPLVEEKVEASPVEEIEEPEQPAPSKVPAGAEFQSGQSSSRGRVPTRAGFL